MLFEQPLRVACLGDDLHSLTCLHLSADNRKGQLVNLTHLGENVKRLLSGWVEPRAIGVAQFAIESLGD